MAASHHLILLVLYLTAVAASAHNINSRSSVTVLVLTNSAMSSLVAHLSLAAITRLILSWPPTVPLCGYRGKWSRSTRSSPRFVYSQRQRAMPARSRRRRQWPMYASVRRRRLTSSSTANGWTG